MVRKIKKLKYRFRNASKKELNQIDDEINSLALENPEKFSNSMLKLVKESVEKAKNYISSKKRKLL